MHLFQNSKGGVTKHLLQMGVGCDGVENDKSRSLADVSNKREYFLFRTILLSLIRDP